MGKRNDAAFRRDGMNGEVGWMFKWVVCGSWWRWSWSVVGGWWLAGRKERCAKTNDLRDQEKSKKSRDDKDRGFDDS